MKAKRLNYLDMAKGIGIILVVTGHSGTASDEFVTWICSFHMPLFMIISGMLLYYGKEEELSFSYSIKKKARSLLVPYALFSLVYLLINLYYATNGSELPPIDALLQTVSFFGLSVLWFLPALFIGETLFLTIRKHTSRPFTALCCLVLFPVFLLLKRLYELYYIPENGPFFLWLSYIIAALLRGGIALLFVAAGYYTMYLLKKLEASRELSRIWFLLSAVVFFLTNLEIVRINGRADFRYMIFNNPVLCFSGAFLGSMAVICLCKALPPIRLLSYLGINSLIIMVTHLDCFVMYIALKFARFMDQFIPFGKKYMLWFYMTSALILMEMIIIYVVNHFFPLLLGRRRQKE